MNNVRAGLLRASLERILVQTGCGWTRRACGDALDEDETRKLNEPEPLPRTREEVEEKLRRLRYVDETAVPRTAEFAASVKGQIRSLEWVLERSE